MEIDKIRLEKEKQTKIEEQEINKFCYELIPMGYLDLVALNKYVKLGKKFNYNFVEYVREDLEEQGEINFFNNVDFTNKLFYVVIDNCFKQILFHLRINETKEEAKKFNQLEENFNPFINALDSWFNNCFDDLDFDLNKEDIIKQARELINKKD